MIEPEVLDLIPVDQPFDFSSELFPLMLDKGLPIFGYSTDAYWTDVGNTDAYLHAHLDVLAGRVDVDLSGFELRPGVWVGDDVEVDDTARLEGPVLIGNDCRVGPGALIGPNSVLGDNVIVGADARTSGAVVMDGGHVGAGGQVHGIVGRNVVGGKGSA